MTPIVATHRTLSEYGLFEITGWHGYLADKEKQINSYSPPKRGCSGRGWCPATVDMEVQQSTPRH